MKSQQIICESSITSSQITYHLGIFILINIKTENKTKITIKVKDLLYFKTILIKILPGTLFGPM